MPILGLRKKRLSPKQIRKEYGRLAQTNISSQDLIDGAEKQWKRFNDTKFQEEEFEKKIRRVFGSRRT